MFRRVFIPFRGYYSSPFSRYGKSFGQDNSIVLAAKTSTQWMEQHQIDPLGVDLVHVGMTVHQHHGFWAGPWASSMMGCTNATGMMLSQACTTGLTSLYHAATSIECGMANTVYCLCTDRTSNGPVVTWPGYDPVENWVDDNFQHDPWGKTSMLETAENAARMFSIDRDLLDEITVCRHQQYADIKDRPYLFKTGNIFEDEGVRKMSPERAARLKPTLSNGVHTMGTVTYPADGHTGIFVSGRTQAKEMSPHPQVTIRVLSYGQSQCKTSHMPVASILATDRALTAAGKSITQMDVIYQHNAFAVNDALFAKHYDLDVFKMNNHGGPLVYGHPQSPVLSRLMIEGLEQLYQRGGGNLLVTGAAGGDMGAAMIVSME